MVHRYLRLLPLLLSVLSLLVFGGFVPRANAAELAPAPAGATEKHEALSLKAEPLFTLGKFTVTNSMLVTWVVAAGIIVFFMVGWLEIVSILFRPISLSFRLYGNVYAGENMLESMAHLVPWASWLIPIPFYFMELLVGVVQALVFMLLTAVFTLLIAHHEPAQGARH